MMYKITKDQRDYILELIGRACFPNIETNQVFQAIQLLNNLEPCENCNEEPGTETAE